MPIPQVPSPLASIIASSTYDADWFAGATYEAQITNAIISAKADGAARVLVKRPYNASLVAFDTAVRMVREGSDWSVFDVKAYGAEGAAVAVAIQAALNAASWGDVVSAPPAAYSLGENTLTIPDGVTLRAASLATYSRLGSSGVSINSTSLPGGATLVVTSTTLPAVVLRSNAVIEGFQFWYPNQTWAITNPDAVFTAYPAAVQLGDATRPAPTFPVVRNCQFLGATRCIGQYATDGTALPGAIIEGCSGVLLGEFLRVARSTEVIRVRHLQFSPNAITNYVGDASVGGVVTAFRTAAARNAKVFHLGNVDDIQAHDIFVYGVRNFVHWNSGFYAGDPNAGFGGSFTNCASDGCHIAFEINRSANVFPVNIANGWFTPLYRPNGVAGDSALQSFIFLDGTNNVRINVNNVRVFGATVGEFSTNYSGAADRSFRGLGLGANNVIFVDNAEFHNINTEIVQGAMDDVVFLDKFTQADIRAVGYVSADRGDVSVTLVVGVDQETQRFATALTANRTITLSTIGAYHGAKFRVVRSGLGAFTLDVGGLKTIPSATAASVDVEYDGTAWRLTGYGTL